MNLGKLLVAGRSIMSGREEISYRANKHVYLPKFGLAQNPFKSPDAAEPAEPEAETAAPIKQVVTGPVQVELSLDSVTVVHNDLSDADVEVVPIKSRTADKTVVPVLLPPEKSWEFLAERMFHATAD
jgi:hypothetical protein